MERPKVISLNEHITCGLCKGYLIEATTITICLHSFCHSCIIKHLSRQEEGNSQCCPTCLDLGVSDISFVAVNDLRYDHILQTIVYKIVPLLYEREQKKRLSYKKAHAIEQAGVDKNNKKKNSNSFSSSRFKIFSSFDVINVEISEMILSVGNHLGNDKNDANKTEDTEKKSLQKCRYLLCPIMLKISHLKKFLLQKVYGGTSCSVILCLNEKPLEDELCLADICYIFGLQKATCVNIRYVAYSLPKKNPNENLIFEPRAAQLPLSSCAGEAPLVDENMRRGSQDLDQINPFINATPIHSKGEVNVNLEMKDNNHNNRIFSTNKVVPVKSAIIDISTGNVNPSLKEVLTKSIQHGVFNLELNKEDQMKLCLDEISNDPSKPTQCLSNVKAMNEVDDSTPAVACSSSSPLSASTLIESPLSLAIPVTTEMNVDSLSDSSSETAMVSPLDSPSAPAIEKSNPTKPCKVILCRLPATCFISDRKRKSPQENLFQCPGDKDEDCVPFYKKKKCEENQQKKTIHSLMIKYKNCLKELIELRRTIQQLTSKRVVQSSKIVFKNSHTEMLNEKKSLVDIANLDLTSQNVISSVESVAITVCSPPVLVNNANVESSCSSNVPNQVISSTESIFLGTSKGEIQDIRRIDIPNKKDDTMPSSTKLLGDMSFISSAQILTNNFVETPKCISKVEIVNTSSGLDTLAIPKCLPLLPTNDLSWILRYAKVCNQDKFRTKTVEATNFVPKCQDVQFPLNLDFIRLASNQQKCCSRINSFQNTNAAIRSNLRAVIPPSNFVRPIQSTVTNQASDLENVKQFLSAIGSLPIDSSLTNSNMSSFDLLAYLEQNHTLMNSVPAANQTLTYCFPLAGGNSSSRQSINQIRRQSVSTQTAQLELLNQYICRRSKPVPSFSVGRVRPINSKRSFDHAFSSNFFEKKPFPGQSKRVRYANEELFSRISTTNLLPNDSNIVSAYGTEINKSHKLTLPSGTSTFYRHVFSELASKSQGSVLKPLPSINQHRVICLTPPTEMQKNQSFLSGNGEIVSCQAPTSRPRSSSANAAEGYETLTSAVKGIPDSIKKFVTPSVDVAQTMKLPQSHLSKQISPGQKESYYSIPKRNIFPIFSRSSKVNIQNFQTQSPSNSSKNGVNVTRDLLSLQARKFLVPSSSHFHLSGWNTAAVGASETLSLLKGQDNNVTLDLSLSKKRKKSDTRLFGDALRVDIPRNCKVANTMTSVNAKRFIRNDRRSDHNGINSNAFPSSLAVTKLSTYRLAQSTHLKGKLVSNESDVNLYNDCPNVIDFRKSLPVTNFKICELKDLQTSALVSSGSGSVSNCSSINTACINPCISGKAVDFLGVKTALISEENPKVILQKSNPIELDQSKSLCLCSKISLAMYTNTTSSNVLSSGSQDISEKQEKLNVSAKAPHLLVVNDSNVKSCKDVTNLQDLNINESITNNIQENIACVENSGMVDIERDIHMKGVLTTWHEGSDVSVPTNNKDLLIENDLSDVNNKISLHALEDFAENYHPVHDAMDNQEHVEDGEVSMEASKSEEIKMHAKIIRKCRTTEEVNVTNDKQSKNAQARDGATSQLIGNQVHFPNEYSSSESSLISSVVNEVSTVNNADVGGTVDLAGAADTCNCPLNDDLLSGIPFQLGSTNIGENGKLRDNLLGKDGSGGCEGVGSSHATQQENRLQDDQQNPSEIGEGFCSPIPSLAASAFISKEELG